MSFRIELTVAGQVLRTAIAEKVVGSEKRIELGPEEWDDVFVYNWGIYRGSASPNALLEGPIAKGTVTHRYGDGCEKLAALIMGDYARTKGPDHPKREESE